jgi:hypothetical protein
VPKAFVRQVSTKAAIDLEDPLCVRIVSDFGAVFLARNGTTAPREWMFADSGAVAAFQSGLAIEQRLSGDVTMALQKASLAALQKAQAEAHKTQLTITPAGPEATNRSYEDTRRLWLSRVEPAVRHWQAEGRLTKAEGARIIALPARQQVEAVLGWEAKGLFFSLHFDKSILYSVAAPGTSQHLSLLALDVREHDSPAVRAILARHGWYQTVYSDLPHFTFVGVSEDKLPRLGLVRWQSGDRTFWVPREKTRGPVIELDAVGETCAF